MADSIDLAQVRTAIQQAEKRGREQATKVTEGVRTLKTLSDKVAESKRAQTALNGAVKRDDEALKVKKAELEKLNKEIETEEALLTKALREQEELKHEAVDGEKELRQKKADLRKLAA